MVCKSKKSKIQYKCTCSEKNCKCPIICFDKEPKSVPHCCGVPMKRV